VLVSEVALEAHDLQPKEDQLLGELRLRKLEQRLHALRVVHHLTEVEGHGARWPTTDVS